MSQHVWVGPEAVEYEASCEICSTRKGSFADDYGWSLSVDIAKVEGRLRRDADVGFTTCRRGHRIVVRRVGKAFAA